MELEYLETLEKRVQEMIAVLRTTKEENRRLEDQMAKQTKDYQRLEQERSLVRERVEKILGALNDIQEEPSSGTMQEEPSSETIQEETSSIAMQEEPSSETMEQGGEQETSY